MVGISGSGKSTYGKKLTKHIMDKGEPIITVSTDEIRAELCGNAADQSKNAEVFKEAYKRLETVLEQKVHCIYDATNLAPDDRKIAIKIARKHGAKVIAFVMNTPLTESIARNDARERVVPRPVIWRQQGRFHSPTRNEVDEIIHIGLNSEPVK